jgi:hypothetical protein
MSARRILATHLRTLSAPPRHCQFTAVRLETDAIVRIAELRAEWFGRERLEVVGIGRSLFKIDCAWRNISREPW